MIRTDRLILRPWRETDKPAFAAMSADPHVMAWLGGVLTREQADAQIDKLMKLHAERGWGVWALEVVGGAEMIGWTGLYPTSPGHPMHGRIEIAWRLARDAWGKGYVTEAAKASLAHGFDELGLEEIVAFTAGANLRSQAVMKRLGMSPRPDLAFEHPREDLGPLRPHVTYSIRKSD